MGPEAKPHPALAALARSVRERLEIARLFGWTVPLRRSRLRPAPTPRRPGPTGPAGAVDTAGPAGALAPGSSAPDAERDRRHEIFRPLREEVEACRRCDLCHSRTRTVFGAGDPCARLMFVGEGPGYDEDRMGEPFVGKAGELLDAIIAAMGFARGEVYIANVVKCRPPGNRTPHPGEIGACAGYLERQIDTVRPQVLVALGAVAARALLGVEDSISRLRGRFHDYRGTPLMPTYHPAYLLRNPADKRKTWGDIQLVMARLGLPPPSRGA